MVPSEISFVHWMLLLSSVAVAWCTFDVWRQGRSSTRWREYLFLLACGAVVGLVAAAVDFVTVRISPEYFLIGKGIEGGDGFVWRALALGLQAGFVAGLVLGCCALFANNPNSRLCGLSFRRLAVHTARSVVAAPLGGFLAGLVCWLGLSARLASKFDLPVEGEAAARFFTVWGTHLGVYAGGVIGGIWVVICVRRERTRLHAV